MTISCPLCKAHPVTIPAWDFSQTIVEVPVCDNHGATISIMVRTSALVGAK